MRGPWRRLVVLLVAGVAAFGSPLRGDQELTTVPIARYRAGALPDDFEPLRSADAPDPGTWRIRRIDGRPAVAQLLAGGAGYQLAVLRAPRLEHLRLGVRVRVGDEGDKAAGLAWRVQDRGNYFAARLDLRQRQFVLYKFVRGNRISLASVGDLRLDDRAWHDLAVEHVGDRVRVWLDGVPIASERDSALATAGRLGLWLPSDSTAYFTDLRYGRLEES